MPRPTPNRATASPRRSGSSSANATASTSPACRAAGWPYVQFRGGPPGFVRTPDAHTLAWADFRGNRQYISTGNVEGDDRVSLFFMDYPNQPRLKVFGHARIVDARDDPDVVAELTVPGYRAVVEQAVVVTIVAFDWNCPQHITPRFSPAELEVAAGPRTPAPRTPMPADRELREVYGHLAARTSCWPTSSAGTDAPTPSCGRPRTTPRGRTSPSLILHIISQQISTAVAVQLFRRVEAAAGGTLDPEGVVGLGTERLRELGTVARQGRAVVGLAERHLAGTLDTDRLAGASDDEVTAALTAARGVGPWTAQMFLIHQLRRPDVLPAGDLGIRHAVAAGWQWQGQGSGLPSAAEVAQLGRGWRPYRTYAAALLWTSLRAEEPVTVSGRG